MNLFRKLYAWRWPVGWWRLRRRGTVKLAGHPVAFHSIAGTQNEWWALAARRREWEQPVVDAFARTIRPGDVVYDVGAWIGPYTLLASRLTGPTGRVLAFEPDPVARAQLERNLALNGAANVQVFPIALGNRDGSARLSGGGSEARVGETGDHAIETADLAGFVAREGHPDVIKIDIEGGEINLATNVIGEARAVFLEVHVPVFADGGVDPEAHLAEIARGRTVERLEGDDRNFNVRIG